MPSKKSVIWNERMNNTKHLSLDERVDILVKAIKELGITELNDGASKKTYKWLEQHGYLPMMFGAAARIVMSRINMRGFDKVINNEHQ